MFKEMRRLKMQLSEDDTADILNKVEYGILSTIGENGYAYGVPVSYVYKDNNIYFHCATEGSKLDNIRSNNKVSFCVVGDVAAIPSEFATKYESVIIFGKAIEVFGDEKYNALMAIVEKYSSQYMEEGKTYIKNADDRVTVIKIVSEHITGKACR